MDDSLIAYIEQMELMFFFSGYALLYVAAAIVALKLRSNEALRRLISNLPLSYALMGTLYLGLQMKNMYPVFSPDMLDGFLHSFLKIFSLVSLLFWFPLFRKRPVLCLLHSLVFFFLMVRNIYREISFPSTGNDFLRNDIKILSASIVLNLAALMLLAFISWLLIRFRRQIRAAHTASKKN